MVVHKVSQKLGKFLLQEAKPITPLPLGLIGTIHLCQLNSRRGVLRPFRPFPGAAEVLDAPQPKFHALLVCTGWMGRCCFVIQQ